MTEGTTDRGNIGVICTAAALVLLLTSSLVDIGRFHTALTAAKTEQTAAVATSARAEAQLDALAKGTQALADGGNANARAILGVLRANGIQINAAANPAGNPAGNPAASSPPAR